MNDGVKSGSCVLNGMQALGRHPGFRVAVAMMGHNRLRACFTVLGIAAAFFLAAAQFGLLVGWIRTNTALILHAGADLWVMAERTPAFDYGTAIPRLRLYQARSVPGVQRASPLFMAWNTWQRPDGRRINVELVGLDRRTLAGGPWEMQSGDLTCIRRPRTAVVDALFVESLGIGPGVASAEMVGREVRVAGVSRGVRTFTASPFVFTALEEAIAYDRRYRQDEITYVMAWCEPQVSAKRVQEEMRDRIPHVEVLTTSEFAVRSARYWMLETGVGITVLVTAVLGLVVGASVTSQTLHALAHEYRGNYATLLALGFHRRRLAGVVVSQALILGLSGVALGSCLYWAAAAVSAKTPIPLETTPAVYAGLCAASLGSCLGAALFALRSVLNLDPVSVFQS
jgi:putative ABC transport system permease protein